jgi:YHS domain-containing protein
MFGKVTDPVCKMKLKKKEATAVSHYGGKDYYFCSENCKKYFDDNHEKYIKPKKRTIDVAELHCGHCHLGGYH